MKIFEIEKIENFGQKKIWGWRSRRTVLMLLFYRIFYNQKQKSRTCIKFIGVECLVPNVISRREKKRFGIAVTQNQGILHKWGPISWNHTILDWTRRAVRPLWRLPSRVPKIAQKSKKVRKKTVPWKSLQSSLKVDFLGHLLNTSENKPNGICVWGRCICHSVKIGQNPYRQTDKPSCVRCWGTRLGLGSPQRGQ